jgi:hypothetical protein
MTADLTIRDRVRRRSAGAVAFACALLAARAGATPPPAASATAPAPPVPATEADQFFQRGRALHQEKKWTLAEDQYRRAWELEKTFRIAANLALVELKLGEARDAAVHLTFALAHLPADDPKMAEVRAHLEGMRQEALREIGLLTIRAAPTGADVFLDDEPVGKTPLEGPLFVSPGHRVIRVEQPGTRGFVRDLTVEPGGEYDLAVSLEPEQAKAATPDPTPPPIATRREAPRSAVPPRTIVLASGAVLALGATGAGAVFAVQWSSERRHAQELLGEVNAASRPGSACTPGTSSLPEACADLRRSVARANDLGERATIAFAIGGGLAAATVATYFLWPNESAHPDSSPHGARITPLLGAGVSGVRLDGAF